MANIKIISYIFFQNIFSGVKKIIKKFSLRKHLIPDKVLKSFTNSN